ncbi:MAG TPA: hypothetical protein VH518_22640 [Tepidisphaeraceae bacterium]|jgi:hypothetical protein
MVLIRRIVIITAVAASVAQAQPAVAPRTLQREARLQELRNIELEQRFTANTNVPPEQRALIDWGGYFSFNYVSLDDQVNDNHVLRQYDFVAYTRLQLDNANEVFLRFRTGYRDFNDGDSFDGHGDEIIDPDLDRAYYRFDLAAYQAAYKGKRTDTDVAIKAGRDLAYWANGLVLAQVMDGITLDVTTANVNVQILGGVTITRTVDFDPSRPAFDHNTRRGFYGGMVSVPIENHTPFVYGLVQRDYNTHDELQTGAVNTKFDYNSYYFGIGSNGSFTDRLRYGLEAVYECGDTLSNSFQIANGALVPVPQTRDSICAYALNGRLDYLIPDEHQSRLSGEVILASGDGDRGSTNTTFNGNKPHTRDNAFNSLGLLNTGLAFAPAVSNVIVGRVGASTYPLPNMQLARRLQIGFDFFSYWKMRSDAPIDEPTLDESYLGVEPDLYLNWQIVSDITFTARYGAFFPNQSAFPTDQDTRQFFFAGVTFAF